MRRCPADGVGVAQPRRSCMSVTSRCCAATPELLLRDESVLEMDVPLHHPPLGSDTGRRLEWIGKICSQNDALRICVELRDEWVELRD